MLEITCRSWRIGGCGQGQTAAVWQACGRVETREARPQEQAQRGAHRPSGEGGGGGEDGRAHRPQPVNAPQRNGCPRTNASARNDSDALGHFSYPYYSTQEADGEFHGRNQNTPHLRAIPNLFDLIIRVEYNKHTMMSMQAPPSNPFSDDQ